jgi:hypothetical protein
LKEERIKKEGRIKKKKEREEEKRRGKKKGGNKTNNKQQQPHTQRRKRTNRQTTTARSGFVSGGDREDFLPTERGRVPTEEQRATCGEDDGRIRRRVTRRTLTEVMKKMGL